MNNANTLPEMHELSTQIGEFVYYWGFKRIHGRIWTHLFLAQRPLDAADLVKLMDISKALVSISLRELMEYEVIQFAEKSARGTQQYKVNPDILSVIMSVLRQREKRMISHVSSAHASLARVENSERERHGLSGEKLDQLGDLVQKAMFALEALIALKPVDLSDWQSAFQLGAEEGPDTSRAAAAKPATSSTQAQHQGQAPSQSSIELIGSLINR